MNEGIGGIYLSTFNMSRCNIKQSYINIQLRSRVIHVTEFYFFISVSNRG